MASNISEVIRASRNAQGMNTRQFGEALGVSYGSISQWERGETEPSEERVAEWFWSNDPLQEALAVEIMVARYRHFLAKSRPEQGNGRS